jgi:putative endonuclease
LQTQLQGRLAQLVQSTSFTPRGSGVRIPQRPPEGSHYWLPFFMPMHYVYILYSESKDRFYVGETAHLEGRLEQHNTGFYKNASTKVATDWINYLTLECEDRSQALKVESFIKRQKSRKFIQKLKMEPELANEILKRFS